MKVYYNESCSICRAEINLYKKQNIKEIEWVDITNNTVAERNTSKSNKALLRRLHVEEGGQIFGGADAFLLLFLISRIYLFHFECLSKAHFGQHKHSRVYLLYLTPP